MPKRLKKSIFFNYFLAAVLAFHPFLAIAAPTGGNIVEGDGSIDYGDSTTVIDQASSRLAIDWSTFNIGSEENVQFVQPSSSAVALNTILDQNPSQIFGGLEANGQVFLTNPNGIFFAPTASLNVGGLVAAGMHMDKDSFMRGENIFSAADGQQAGYVVNHGTLQAANGGSINLLGGTVANRGLIVANYGQVNLISGNKVVVDFDGDGLIQFEVTEDVITNAEAADASVVNSGEINANGGQVLLSGNAAQDVFSSVVNNEGLIKANRIDNSGGVVRLMGNGKVLHSGEIDVSGVGANSTGGTAHVLGNKTGLFEDASINASGDAGGGEVLIGGDYQGNNPDIQNGESTYVSEDATVNANANVSGDGGKVIVWADNATQYYGSINATGGNQNGDGGLAEVSGKGYLDFSGNVDLTATNGNKGSLLLDPQNIIIADSGTDAVATNDDFIENASGTSTISPTDLVAAINSADVILQAHDDITVSDDVDASSANPNDLTLEAGDDIHLDAIITLADDINAKLTLIAGSGGATPVSPDGTADIDGAGETYVRDLQLTAAGNINLTGFIQSEVMDIDVTGLNSSIYVEGNVYAVGSLNADASNGSGGIYFDDQGSDLIIDSVDAGTGTVELITSGALDELADNSDVDIIGSAVTLTAAGRIGNTGGGNAPLDINTTDLTLDGGGTINVDARSNSSTLVDLASLNLTTSANFDGTSDIQADNLTFNVTESGALAVTDISDSTNLDLTLTHNAAINIGSIDVGSGDLALTAVGTIDEITDDSNVNITANQVTLTATDRIGNTADNAEHLDINSSNIIVSTDDTVNIDVRSDSSTLIDLATLVLTFISGGNISNNSEVRANNLDTFNLVESGNVITDFDIDANDDIDITLNSFSSIALGNIDTVAGDLTLSSDSAITQRSGEIISATNNLVKNGSGTLTLSETNTYTGTTTINSGNVVVTADQGLGTAAGGTTIASGLTIDFQSVVYGTAEALTLESGSTIATSTGTSSFAGNIDSGTSAAGDINIDVDGTQLTLSGVIADGTNALGLANTGSGTTILTGTNTYDGTTAINSGTLAVTANDGLGSNTGGTTVASGATLDLQNVAYITTEGLTLDSGSTLATSTGTSSFAGAIDSGTSAAGNTTIDVDGTQLTLSGVIADGSNALGLINSGSGITVLTGTNTYDGTTAINSGTLAVTANDGLGSNTGGTSVASGATLDLRNVAYVTTEGLTLDSGSTLATSTGTSSFAGAIDSGTSAAGDATIDVDGTQLTLSGVIDDGTNALGLINSGSGTTILTGTNTYDGTTAINSGTLAVTANDGLGSNTGGTTVASGATLDLQSVAYVTTEGLTLDSGSTLATSTGTSSFAGAIDSGTSAAGDATIDVDGTQLTLSGIIADGTNALGLINSGSGITVLTGTNTYDGTTAINSGTLAITANDGLGSNTGGTTVASAATLDLQNVAYVTTEGLTLDSGSTLATSTGTSSFAGNIDSGTSLAGDATIDVDGTQLTLSGVIDDGTNALGLINNGSGITVLSGSNTYTGTTAIDSGTVAVTSNNSLGTTAGGTTVASGATLDFQNVAYSAAESIDFVSGSTIATSVGTSSFNGDIDSGTSAAGDLTVDVTGTQLTLSGTIADGTNALGLINSGSGITVLTGTNTYDGTTAINSGTLAVTANDGLGSNTGGTTVASGATLDLQNVAYVTTEGLTLDSGSTLATSTGTSSFAGAIDSGTSAAGDATIDVDGTQLTLSGVIDDGTNALGLINNGSGITVLSGSNTYTGTTAINSGILGVTSNSSLGTTAGGTTVASGATLDFQNVAYSAAETIDFVSGSSIATSVGTSSFNGDIDSGTSAAGDLTIDVDGTQLTLSGTIADGTNALGLINTGSGTTVLTGTNTYTGTTAVNSGTLGVASNSSLGTAAGGTTVASGAALDFQNVIYGAAEAISFDSGSTIAASTGTSSFAGDIDSGTSAAGDLTIDVDGTQLTLSGVIADGTNALGLLNTGSGTTILSGTNTYTGDTAINSGTVAVTVNDALGTTAGGTTVASGATLDLQNVAYVTTEGLTLDSGSTLATSTGTSSFAGAIDSGTSAAGDTTIDVDGTQLTLSGVIADGTNALGLLNTGSGTTILSGTNTYDGSTAINSGTVVVTSNNALGSNTGTTTVASGATLDLQNVAYVTTEGLTLDSGSTLATSTGTSSFAGNIDSGTSAAGNATINVTGTQLTLSGVIADGTNALGLINNGSGTTVLTGTNTYDGSTAINSGTVEITANDALGSTTGGTSVASGATLDLQNVVYVSTEGLTLDSGSTLATSTGTSSFAGNIDSGTSAAGDVTINVTGTQLTLSGVIADGTNALGLINNGSGTTVLTGTNTYDGSTAINSGTVEITANDALGSTTGGTSVASGAALDLQNVIYVSTEGLTLDSGSTLATSTGTSSFDGDIDSGTSAAGDATITVAGTQLSLNGNISDGSNSLGLINNGSGSTVLAGNNTYTGTTAINSGTVAVTSNTSLGTVAGGTTVASGAALDIQNTIYSAAETIAFDSGSTIAASVGTSEFAGDINSGTSAAGDLTVNVTGTQLTLSGTIADGTNALGLINTGSGTTVLTGTNTYTGTTAVNSGILGVTSNSSLGTTAGGTTVASGSVLDFQNVTYSTAEAISFDSGSTIATSVGTSSFAGDIDSGTSAAGNLTIDVDGTQLTLSGDIADGTNDLGLVKTGTGEAILTGGTSSYDGTTEITAGTLAITDGDALGSTTGGTTVTGGTLDIASGINVNDALSLNGGSVEVTSGTAFLLGSVSLDDDSIITGTGNLTFFGSSISGAAGNDLTKNGSGTLTLNANSYDGETFINAGTVTTTSNNALGSATGGTTVASGATLELQNATYSTAESLTLESGSTLSSTSGNSSFAGNIDSGTSAAGDANITVTGIQLTLSGVIADGTNALGLINNGSGTTVLTGTNTYDGSTAINSGTVEITANDALGSTTGGTSVASGATLDLQNVVYVSTEGLTLDSGSTLATSTGTSSFAGNIDSGTSAAGNTTIDVDGTQLTLSGVIADGTNALGLINSGSGITVLTGTNTYDGDTAINSGTVEITANDALGSNTGGTSVASGATLDLQNVAYTTTEALTLDSGSTLATSTGTSSFDGDIDSGTSAAGDATITVNGTQLSLNGNISNGSNSLGLINNGSGSTVLAGNNTYTGTTAINSGTVAVTSNTSLGTVAGGTTVASGAALDIQNTIYSAAETIAFDSGSTIAASVGTSEFAGDINSGTSAAGDLTVNVTGTQLTLSGTIADGTNALGLINNGSGTTVLTGTNTYTGTTAVNSGILAVTSNSSLGTTASGTTVASGAALDFQNVIYGAAEAISFDSGSTIAASTGTSSFAGNIDSGTSAAGNLTIDVDGTQLTLSGLIDDGTNALGLVKTGTGEAILGGNSNFYDGTTEVTAGTLTVTQDDSLGSTSGGTTVSGGTLDIAGGVAIYDDLSLNGGTVEVTSGTASLLASVSLDDDSIITGAGNLDFFGGSISGAAGNDLTKNGSGTLSLDVNSYDGATFINAGTVVATANNALGSTTGGTTVASGATLEIQNVLYSTTEGLTLESGSTLASTGTSSFSGNIDSGTSTAGDAIIDTASLFILDGVIADGTNALGLSFNGAGATALSGTNTYDGDTSVNSGTLTVDTNDALGSNTGGTTVASGATLDFFNVAYTTTEALTLESGSTLATSSGTSSFAGNIDSGTSAAGNATIDVDGTQLTLSGVIADGTNALGLINSGSGITVLTGTNTYDGSTAINSGTVEITANDALGSTTGGTSVASGATLDLQNVAYVTTEALTLESGSTLATSTGTSSFAGDIDSGTSAAGDATITVNGTQLSLNGNISDGTNSLGLINNGSGSTVLAGNNTYTGTTAINSGTVAVTSNTSLGTVAGGTTVASGAALDIQNTVYSAAETIAFDSGSTIAASVGTSEFAGDINSGTSAAGDLTVNVTGTQLTLSGTIADGTNALGLVNNGSGTTVLTGTNTYTGTTAVNSGILAVTSNSSLGSTAGDTTVASGAALDFQNVIYSTAEDISFDSGSTIATSVGTSSFAGGIDSGTSAAGNLSIDVDGTQLTLSGVIADGTSALGLVKTGSGEAVLSGNNTYDGTSEVSAGTLSVTHDNALGSTTGGTTVTAGTLDIAGGLSIADALSLNGGAVEVASGFAIQSGLVSIDDDSIITGDGAFVISSVVSGAAGNDLIKNGTGTLFLTNANTYSGATQINDGTLTVTMNDGLGTTTGTTTVASGATLDVRGATYSTTEALTLESGSTLANSNNTSSFAGNIDSGTSAAGNVNINVTGDQLTLSGVIADGANALGLINNGSGTTVLTGTNTYDGSTAINSGTVEITANDALGSTTGGTSVASGAALDLQNVVYVSTEGLTLDSGSTLATTTGTSSFAGNIDSGTSAAGDASINVTGTQLTLSGVIADGTNALGLINNGSGTTVLTGTNTYDGSTAINSGTVEITANDALGSNTGGTTVASGASLDLQNVAYVTTEGLTLDSGSTLATSTGTSSFAGDIDSGTSAAGDATITVAGTQLSLNGNISDGTNSLGLINNGSGSTVLAGNNSYTGTTAINSGTVAVTSNTSLGTVAGGTTVASGAALDIQNTIYSAAETIAFDSGSTIAASVGTSEFAGDINSGTSAAGDLTVDVDGTQLTLSGTIADGTNALGLVNSGSGLTVLTGTNTYTGTTAVNSGSLAVTSNSSLGSTAGGTTVASGSTLDFQNVIYSAAEAISFDSGSTIAASVGTSSFAGDIDSGTSAAGDLTVDVDGTQLTLNGVIADGVNDLGLIKTGTGIAVLGGSNTYDGSTAVNSGTIALSSNNALGSTVGGTTVASGAALDFQNVIYGATEAIAFDSGSTIAASTGTSSFAGDIDSGTSAAGDLTIDVDGSQLTLSGVIADGTNDLGLIKTGSGEAVLSGTNTYDGDTVINSGTLAVTVNDALGTTTGGTTVASGAILDLQGVTYATTEALTLESGSTLATSSGTSSFAGNIDSGTSAAGDANINVTGTQLTLSGVIDDGTNALGLINNGSGITILSGTNTYDGDTAINSGTLAVTANDGLGSTTGETTVASGATLDLQNVNYTTLEALTLEAGSTLATSTGTSSFDGDIDSGTSAAGDATITVAGTQLSLNGNISDGINSLGLINNGSGSTVLAGTNTYTGTTAIDSGTVAVTSNTSLGSTAGATTVSSGAALDIQNTIYSAAETISFESGSTVAASVGTSEFAGDINSGTSAAGDVIVNVTGTQLTLSGTIADGTNALGLVNNGSGLTVLTGTNTYTGTTAVDSGNLAVTSNSSLGSTAGGTIVANSAGLDFQDVIYSAAEAITFESGSTIATSVGTSSFAGDIDSGTSAAGDVTVNVTGTQLTLSGTIADGANALGLVNNGSGITVLSGTNTYTGATAIDSGNIAITSNSSFGSTAGGTTVASGAGLDFQNVIYSAAETISFESGSTIAASVGTSSFAGDIDSGTSAAGDLTIDVDGTQLTLSGVIDDGINALGLVKTGTGELILSGLNVYDGDTDISSGTVSVQSDSALGLTAGTTTVSSGATLDFQNTTYTVAETINLEDGSLLSASTGTSSFVGTVQGATAGSATAAIDVASGTDFTISGLINNGASTTLDVTKTGTGTLNLGGLNNGYSGDTNVNAGTLAVSADGALGTSGTAIIANAATIDFQNVFYIGGGSLEMQAGSTLASSTGNASYNGSIDSGTSAAGTLSIDIAGTSLSLDGVISDGSNTLGINKTGAGTVTLNNSANTYTGDTTVTAGTLAIGAADAIVTTNDVYVTGGVFDTNAAQTIDELFLTGGAVTGSGSTLTVSTAIDVSGTSSIDGGDIVLDGNFSQSAGTLTLPGVAGSLTVAGDWVNTGGSLDGNSGTVTFDGSNQSLTANGTTFGTIAIDTTGTFTFNDVFGADAVNASATATDIDFNSASLNVSGVSTLANTGTVTFGDEATDDQNFDGGISVTTATSDITGILSSDSGNISLDAATLTGSISATAPTSSIDIADLTTTVSTSITGGSVTVGSLSLDDNNLLTITGNDVELDAVTGQDDDSAGASDLTIDATGTLTLNDTINTDMGNLIITAGDLVITNTANAITADAIHLGSTAGTALLVTSADPSGISGTAVTTVDADNSFVLSNDELLVFTADDGDANTGTDQLTLTSDTLIYLGGDVTYQNGDNGLVLASDQDIYLGGMRWTAGSEFYGGADNTEWVNGQEGVLVFDSLSATAGEDIYTFDYDSIDVAGTLSLDAGDSLFLSTNPFLGAGTSNDINLDSAMVANNIVFSAGAPVEINDELTITVDGSGNIDFSGLEFIRGTTADTNAAFQLTTNGGDISIGNVGEEANAVDSVVFNAGGGSVFLSGDIYTNDSISISDETTLGITLLDDIILSSNGAVALGAIDGSDSSTANGFDLNIIAEVAEIGGISDVTNLNITSTSATDTTNFNETLLGAESIVLNGLFAGASSLDVTATTAELNGSLETAGDLVFNVDDLTVDADLNSAGLVQVDSDTSQISGSIIAVGDILVESATTTLASDLTTAANIDIVSNTASLEGTFAGTAINLSEASQSSDISITGSGLFLQTDNLTMGGSLQVGGATTGMTLADGADLDLTGVSSIELTTDANFNVNNGNVNFGSAVLVDNTLGGVSLNIIDVEGATGGGTITLGTIVDTVKSISVDTANDITLQGGISTLDGITLISDGGNVETSLAAETILNSSSITLGGTYSTTDSALQLTNSGASASLVAGADLDLSVVTLNDDAANLAGLSIDSNGFTVTLGATNSTSLDLAGNYALAGDINISGLEGDIEFKDDTTVELINDVTIDTYTSNADVIGSEIIFGENVNFSNDSHDLNLIAGTGINMASTTEITSTSGSINATSQTGDIGLGQLDAGSGDINLTASTGSVLSTFGSFGDSVDFTEQINLDGDVITIDAQNQIGEGSNEPIIIAADDSINLEFGAAEAFILNLNNVPVNSEGSVVDVFTDRFEASDLAQVTANNTLETFIDYDQYLEEQAPLVNVLTADSDIKEEESSGEYTISSLIPDVPMMVKTNKGWSFVRARPNVKASAEENKKKRRGVEKVAPNKKRVEWLKGSFRYETPN